jgi:hypothetical protein
MCQEFDDSDEPPDELPPEELELPLPLEREPELLERDWLEREPRPPELPRPLLLPLRLDPPREDDRPPLRELDERERELDPLRELLPERPLLLLRELLERPRELPPREPLLARDRELEPRPPELREEELPREPPLLLAM